MRKFVLWMLCSTVTSICLVHSKNGFAAVPERCRVAANAAFDQTGEIKLLWKALDDCMQSGSQNQLNAMLNIFESNEIGVWDIAKSSSLAYTFSVQNVEAGPSDDWSGAVEQFSPLTSDDPCITPPTFPKPYPAVTGPSFPKTPTWREVQLEAFLRPSENNESTLDDMPTGQIILEYPPYQLDNIRMILENSPFSDIVIPAESSR